MITTLEAIHSYIDGQRVHLQTDHKNILWLSRVKQPSGRLGRWIMRLSEFDAVFSYKQEQYMHVAD